MTSLSVRMCSIMVAVLLTTAMAVPAPGSQKGQQALQPGQQFDPCEFEGRFWQFGEKFESYDKINRCKRVCFCQGNINGVYCKPGCAR